MIYSLPETYHNVISTSNSKPIKLHTIYMWYIFFILQTYINILRNGQ